jgi:hypothetical protein
MPVLPLEVVRQMSIIEKTEYQKQLARERKQRQRMLNPEKYREYNKKQVQKYRKKNPEKYREQNRRYAKAFQKRRKAELEAALKKRNAKHNK